MDMQIVELIKANCDPFKELMWGRCERLTKKLVRQCIEESVFVDSPQEFFDLESDAARIAYLVCHGWHDEITCKDKVIIDGWHRFAAAVYRKDTSIGANNVYTEV